jgi:hypothetical protein
MLQLKDFIISNDIKKNKKFSKPKMEELDFKRLLRDFSVGIF